MNLIKVAKGDNEKGRRIELMTNAMLNMIEWGSKNVDVIIVEGIFNSKRYSNFYKKILSMNVEILWYYFDLSFEETLVRHATREKSKLFGAEEMKGWFNPHDELSFVKEKVIGASMSKDEILNMILDDMSKINTTSDDIE